MDNFNDILVHSTEGEQKMLIFIIMTVIILVPLAIITALFSITSESDFIKSLLIIICTAMFTTLLAVIVLRYPLKTQRFLLSTSDSVIIDQGPYRTFCEHVKVSSKKKRSNLDVWSIDTTNVKLVKRNVTLNRVFDISVNKIKIIPFDLLNDDKLSVEFAKDYHINVTLIDGLSSFNSWAELKFSTIELEACCDAVKLEIKARSLKYVARRKSLIFLVFHLSPPEESVLSQNPKQKTSITTTMYLHRVTMQPSPCDSLLCDDKDVGEHPCLLDHFPSRVVISGHYKSNTSPLLHSSVIEVSCQPRSWVFGIIFGLVPIVLLFVIIYLINYTRVCQFRKRYKKTTIQMDLV